jgi:hypothetical protein
MRFMLITFEPGHLRSSYLVGRWGGGQDLSTKCRVGPKGTEMRFMLITFEPGYLRSSYLVGRWGGA